MGELFLVLYFPGWVIDRKSRIAKWRVEKNTIRDQRFAIREIVKTWFNVLLVTGFFARVAR